MTLLRLHHIPLEPRFSPEQVARSGAASITRLAIRPWLTKDVLQNDDVSQLEKPLMSLIKEAIDALANRVHAATKGGKSGNLPTGQGNAWPVGRHIYHSQVQVD